MKKFQIHPYLKAGIISWLLLIIAGILIHLNFNPTNTKKKVCKQLLAEEITEKKASDILIGNGWRGGGQDTLVYHCGYFLKEKYPKLLEELVEQYKEKEAEAKKNE